MPTIGDAGLGEARRERGELLALERAARGVVARIEVQHQLACRAQSLSRHAAAAGGGQREVGTARRSSACERGLGASAARGVCARRS